MKGWQTCLVGGGTYGSLMRSQLLSGYSHHALEDILPSPSPPNPLDDPQSHPHLKLSSLELVFVGTRFCYGKFRAMADRFGWRSACGQLKSGA